MKIAILNDTHCGARNSSDIFIDYQEQFYTDIFFPYLKKEGITDIIHLGDYFEHRKFVNFKALRSNREHFIEQLEKHGITMHIIAGNHDVFYKNTNDINSIDELLGGYDCVVHHRDTTVLEFEDVKVGLVPWINKENQKESVEFIMNCDADILAGHFEIIGFEMYRGVKNKEGMDTSPLERFNLVVSGHFHTKSNKGNIHYLGSQMEFTWADAEDPKYFHVYDTDKNELTAVRNPITLFRKINYNDSEGEVPKNLSTYKGKFVKVIVEEKNDIHKFDQFIQNLQLQQPADFKIVENFQEFSGEGVDDETINLERTETLLDSYIEGIETTLDHDILKKKTRALYIEALEMESI